MNILRNFLSIILITTQTISSAQNLPSLLTEENINSTFSIVAYDESAKEWGIAVATDNICVGNSTIYITPGVGAFSVIADTDPKYGIEGLNNLIAGNTIEQAITKVKKVDKNANYRQVAGLDAEGRAYAFTGKALKFWNGKASQIVGKNYVVMGNQLANEVLTEMSKTFENSEGTLAERLLISLVAGQAAGGQISGKQSAALVVKGTHNEWYNQIDLRVDNSKNPIIELQTLLNYYNGRIRLNQALYAFKNGNTKRAEIKLSEAESMLDGWTGIYSRIAATYITMGNEDAAVEWVKKGMDENPNWAVNIPAFYCLKDHPKMKSLIKTDLFDIKDWENALAMLSNLGRELEIIEVGENLLNKNIESSYLNFLIGRSHFYEDQKSKAIQYLEKACRMDGDNIEARELLSELKSK